MVRAAPRGCFLCVRGGAMKQIIDILGHIEAGKITGPMDTVISHVTADSREVRKGSLFICLKGATVDGHAYVRSAIEKGAVAVLISDPVEVPPSVSVITVSDTRKAMQTCVPYFYDYPARKMRMIGVTGTNGKTTTSHMIGHILREQGHTVGIIGTVHVLIGKESYEVNNTTPDVVDLQQTLQKMVETGVTHCVMEVSSHALDMGRVDGVEYDTAVFTNLTQDHLDYHKTLENYLAAKAKLFTGLSDQGAVKAPKGAVINVDDAYSSQIVEKTAVQTIGYGIHGECNLTAKDLQMTANDSSYAVILDGSEYRLHIGVAGLFNVYNTLAAIGAARLEGVAMEHIIEALESFDAVPGRFELIDEGQDFAVVVDYAHTPDGLENILKTAKEIVTNKIHVVFGCGGDRDATKRPIMGRIAAQYGDVVYVTSDNPRTEDPIQIVKDVEKGVREGLRSGVTYEVIVDRREAIQKAIRNAAQGDVVMIAGKGHEDYQILKDKTIHFDDREEARSALKER